MEKKKLSVPPGEKKLSVPPGEKKLSVPPGEKKEEHHPARGGEREMIQWEERERREIYIASVGKKVNLRAGMAALGEE